MTQSEKKWYIIGAVLIILFSALAIAPIFPYNSAKIEAEQKLAELYHIQWVFKEVMGYYADPSLIELPKDTYCKYRVKLTKDGIELCIDAMYQEYGDEFHFYYHIHQEGIIIKT